MNHRAMRSEIPYYLSDIQIAELSYHATTGQYLAAYSETKATNDILTHRKRLHDFPTHTEWKAMGWQPEGKVRGAYWVELTQSGFIAHGICDVDNDGQLAHYTITETGSPTLLTPENVY